MSVNSQNEDIGNQSKKIILLQVDKRGVNMLAENGNNETAKVTNTKKDDRDSLSYNRVTE